MTSSDPCAHDHGDDAQARTRRARERLLAVRHVFVVTLVLNAVVAISKAAYSYASGSIALGADSLHSVLDGSSNVLALLGLHWSAAPADPRHPYGRRKIEILVALGIGVLIVIGLYEFAEVAIRSLISHARPPEVGWGGFALVLGTMVVNFFVTRYEHRKAHELHSHLLHADAQHTQSDLFASGAVVLSFIAVRNGLAWADSVGALILLLLVGRVAWIVFRENVPVLLDAAVLDPARVADLARLVPGIASVHSVRSRGIRSAVELDLHMEVAPDMSVAAAHELAVRIERDVKETFPEVSDVVIHVEPCIDKPPIDGAIGGAIDGPIGTEIGTAIATGADTKKTINTDADDKPAHRHRDPHSHS